MIPYPGFVDLEALSPESAKDSVRYRRAR